MSTFYAMVRENGVFFYKDALKGFSQASIRDVPVIDDVEIIAAEGRHIVHDGNWIPILTVESLVAEPKPKSKVGSVDKAEVVTRIKDHLLQQSDDEVTLSDTSTHCEVIGGRIAKQVISTIEAKKYLNEHIESLGWEVDKAGKDFIRLKRKRTGEKAAVEEVNAAIGQVHDYQESLVLESAEGRRSFLGIKLPL